MPSRWSLAGAAVALSLGSAPLLADVWDVGTNHDNGATTDNVPIHGTVQVHDLAANGSVIDQDWYTIEARPFASYEAVIEGLTGDLVLGPTDPLAFHWLASNGTTVLVGAVPFGGGCDSCSQTTRFENNIANPRTLFIRVRNPACGSQCDEGDEYTFRLFETTYVLPRYNNTGSQVTVLIIHNFSEMDVGGHIHLFNPEGVRVGGQSFGLLRNNHTVINSATIPGGAGTAGIITISHTGRYGSLAGKAVVLDPATGFSFDTPLTPKPMP